MSKNLNLFPVRAAIGTVQPNGDVLMTAEFARAMADLLTRVGGASSMDMQELAALTSVGTDNSQALAHHADIDALRVSNDIASITALRAEMDELRSMLAQVGPALDLYRMVEQIKVELAMIEDPAAQVRYIITRYATLAAVQKKQDKIIAGTVTGSRGGNAALASLLSVLSGQGLINDSTTA